METTGTRYKRHEIDIYVALWRYTPSTNFTARNKMANHNTAASCPELIDIINVRNFRIILGASLIILCVYAIIPSLSSFSFIKYGILCCSIGYFIATDFWLRVETQQTKRRRILDSLTTLDAFIIGLTSGYYCHAISISLIFYGLIFFNGILLAGIRRGFFDSLGFTSAILLSITVNKDPWTISTNTPMLYIAAGLAFAYLGYYARTLNSKVIELVKTNEKVTSDQIRYKLHTYKLAKYLTPTVWRAIVEGREKSLKTERKRVTVFFSDITGFSALTEELEAETLTDLLNTYLTEMSKIASKHKGTIDKFMGDGIMVIFGDTQSQGMKADCLRGMSMAIEMRRKMKELETHWFNQGIKKPLKIRMGLNTGFCTVGSFGTSHYMDYTVLGMHVNLASRLESAAEPGEILISHETWALIKDVIMCRDKGEIRAKGFTHPIKVYQVADFRKDLGKNQSYFQENTEGFSMHLDLEKIRNYDKERVIEYLDNAVEKLKDKIIP